MRFGTYSLVTGVSRRGPRGARRVGRGGVVVAQGIRQPRLVRGSGPAGVGRTSIRRGSAEPRCGGRRGNVVRREAAKRRPRQRLKTTGRRSAGRSGTTSSARPAHKV